MAMLKTYPLCKHLEKAKCSKTGKFITSGRSPVSGVYRIFVKKLNHVYVGASKNIWRRRQKHARALLLQQHKNKRLQKDFNKLGAQAFQFEILEEVTSPKNLIKREQFWMDKQAWLYNFGTAESALLGYKPSRKLLARRREVAIQNWANGSFHRKASASTRKRLSESHKGLTRSRASRIKQSKTIKEKNLWKLLLTTSTMP